MSDPYTDGTAYGPATGYDNNWDSQNWGADTTPMDQSVVTQPYDDSVIRGYDNNPDNQNYGPPPTSFSDDIMSGLNSVVSGGSSMLSSISRWVSGDSSPDVAAPAAKSSDSPAPVKQLSADGKELPSQATSKNFWDRITPDTFAKIGAAAVGGLATAYSTDKTNKANREMFNQRMAMEERDFQLKRDIDNRSATSATGLVNNFGLLSKPQPQKAPGFFDQRTVGA